MNEQQLTELLNEEISSVTSLGGGCIANTKLVKTVSGRRLVVKESVLPGMSLNEANGLRELKRTGVIKVPDVIFADAGMLIIEYISQGSKGEFFFENFGRQLAQMHRHTRVTFGWDEDNYIGTTLQLNQPVGDEMQNWTDFYFNKRLLFQYQLAERNGYVTDIFKQLFRRLESRLPIILKGSGEPPSLLHGDLWSGNYLVDEHGQPVLIDPAVYYGHREAELAMTHLFGGFSENFYLAYREEWPLPEGANYRQGVYTLYHVMNHLNMFGAGYYLSQTLSLMRQYV
jgi:fructosamine-3-kinase